MDGEIKTVDFGFFVHAQRGDQADQFNQNIGHNHGEDTDDGQSAQLSGPCALAEDSDHDGAEDVANAVHGKHIQCVVNLGFVAHEVHSFLTQDAGAGDDVLLGGAGDVMTGGAGTEGPTGRKPRRRILAQQW